MSHTFVIVGSRDPAQVDRFELWAACGRLYLSVGRPERVRSGGQTGADRVGEDWARAAGIPFTPHPYPSGTGRKGGPIRNQEMIDAAVAEHGAENVYLIGYPAAVSPGTRDVVLRALGAGCNVRLVGPFAGRLLR